jgi:hypothetical protein
VPGLGGAAATPEFLAHLAELLRDKNKEVREAAARALGRLMAQEVRIFEGLTGKWEGRSVAELSQWEWEGGRMGKWENEAEL